MFCLRDRLNALKEEIKTRPRRDFVEIVAQSIKSRLDGAKDIGERNVEVCCKPLRYLNAWSPIPV